MATKTREEYDQELVAMFKQFNKVMIWMWKLGLGRFINLMPASVGQIMVLVHTGRKSGLTRRTPLNFARIGDGIYCLAGFGPNAHWYKNVKANPQVEVWLPDGWWAGMAQEVTERDDHLQILRAVLKASGFAASEFEGVDAATITDDELADLMHDRDYRLIHIQRTERRSGSGGPGEYTWVWWLLLSALVMLALLIRGARGATSKGGGEASRRA